MQYIHTITLFILFRLAKFQTLNLIIFFKLLPIEDQKTNILTSPDLVLLLIISLLLQQHTCSYLILASLRFSTAILSSSIILHKGMHATGQMALCGAIFKMLWTRLWMGKHTFCKLCYKLVLKPQGLEERSKRKNKNKIKIKRNAVGGHRKRVHV